MSREETMRRLGAYPKTAVDTKTWLEGAVVLLDAESFRGDDYERLFVATGGFGCAPRGSVSGSAVLGFFVADGENARVERCDVTHVFEGMPAPEKAPDLCAKCTKPIAKDEMGSFDIIGRKWHQACSS